MHAFPSGRYSTHVEKWWNAPAAAYLSTAARDRRMAATGLLVCGVVGLVCGTHNLSLHMAFWTGVCPAGLVGGQDTQPGSTRNPSPAVAVVARGSSNSGLSTRIYLGGGAGNAAHSTDGPDLPVARNPLRPRDTAPGWRHPAKLISLGPRKAIVQGTSSSARACGHSQPTVRSRHVVQVLALTRILKTPSTRLWPGGDNLLAMGGHAAEPSNLF